MKRRPRASLAALALVISGCVEAPASCPAASLSPLERAPAFAVVASDYSSSAVGLLDAQGQVVTEAWLDSGSVRPGIVPSLRGDVVLPQAPVAPCVLTVIDRFGTDVVSFFDLCAGEGEPLIGQLDAGSTFSANPQDVLLIDERRAYVSRSNPSPFTDVEPLERGNDLLLIDWREQRILSRVDLSPLDVVDEERLYARPGQLAMIARGGVRRAIVGLARLSLDHFVAAEGAVGVIDPETAQVAAVPLAGLASCAELDRVPGHPELVLVTCGGPTFADEAARRAGAGVAMLELADDGAVRVRSIWRAADHPDEPVFNTFSVVISPRRVVAVAMGSFGDDIDDRVALLDLEEERSEPLFTAESAFVIGDGVYDPTQSLLLIPDAHTGTVRRFEVSADGEARELEPVDTAGCRGLPPREVRPLAVTETPPGG